MSNYDTDPSIAAAWDRLPNPAERERNEALRASLATTAQVASEVTLGQGSSTAPAEWTPEDRDEPGEPHSYGGSPEDADRFVDLDDDAYERA